MVSEPLATYDVHHTTTIRPRKEGNEDRSLLNTVSVDEYFDELISLVHQDYANL